MVTIMPPPLQPPCPTDDVRHGCGYMLQRALTKRPLWRRQRLLAHCARVDVLLGVLHDGLDRALGQELLDSGASQAAINLHSAGMGQ